MSDYWRLRKIYPDLSGSVDFTASTDDQTPVAGKAGATIFLQRLHVHVTAGSAGKTLAVTDDNGTPLKRASALDLSTTDAHYDIDYGTNGAPLTSGKGLKFDVSAVGAAFVATWEAYRKPDSPVGA